MNPTASSCPMHFPFHRTSVTDIPLDYIELRANNPVAKVILPTGDTGYVVSRYEDVRMVLSDPRFSRAETILPNVPKLSAVDFPAGSLFTLDPPHHTRLRKLVSDEFTPRRIQNLVPHIQKITDDLLDRLAVDQQPVDINLALAFPLPVIVICELLGVPLTDREHFRRWADASISLTADPTEALSRQKEMVTYFSKLIERKRVEGGGDLLSALIVAHDEDGKLSQMELIVMAMSLLVAGFETTGSVIGTGVLTLLRHPDRVQKLLKEPGHIDVLVEELLRLNPIGDGGPVRITLEEVNIAGVTLSKGSLVIASVSSGNFDHHQFDQPKTLNTDRNHNRHLAFGHGIHYCLGASLARAELRIVISTLFQRFPTLRLACPIEELKMKVGMLFHRLERLPVTW